MTPTRTTPWMALAPDIRGVCRVAGTLLITSKPTSRLSTNTDRSAISCALMGYLARRDGRVDDLAVTDQHDARVDLVGGVDVQPRIPHQVEQQRGDVARV